MGADPRAADKAGTTALMIAAERADSGMLELLLAHGADPKAADSRQRTALFYAARANQAAGVRMLQHAGAALDARDGRGYNALDAALAVGADGRRRGAALPRRAGQSGQGQPRTADRQVRSGASRRHLSRLAAARAGRCAQGHGQRGAAARRRRGCQSCACRRAIRCCRSPPMRMRWKYWRCCSRTAPMRLAGDHSGHSVLWLAAARNDLPLLRALLNAGVKPDAHAATETAPLLAAMGAAHSDAALALLAAGADAEAADAQGRTPLMLACAAGQVALVENLLARHVRVEAADHGGRSALWYAAAAGSRGAVVLLLADGADAGKGRCARTHGTACGRRAGGHGRARRLLLAADARMNRRSDAGDTPLMIAAASGHTEVVEALLVRAPDLDVQNGAGDTALMAASRGGHQAICHMLLAAGANKSLRNGAGVSAADIASARGFESIAKEIGGKS